MSEEAWAQEYRYKQNYEWTLPSTSTPVTKMAHWAAFVVLSSCTVYLAVHAWNAKGPSGNQMYFYGYKEEMMISIYVNLFAAVAYYGKVVADTYGHHYVNSGPVIPVMGNYAYMDYISTCPLLVYDLLGQLRAPYKTTCSVLIFLVLLTGVVTNFYEGDHFKGPAYAWFGLGMVLFAVDYFLLYKIVTQQYSKLETLSYQSHAKKALFPLKMAIGTFFVVWIIFPIVWILSSRGLGVINDEAVEVLHALCDIVAKSVYGFMLARFRTYFDKKLFNMLEDLGLDGEEEMEALDREMAHQHVDEQQHLSTHGPNRKASILSPIDSKIQSSLVRDPIDTSGDIVHAIGPTGSALRDAPFLLTPRGEVQLTPRGEQASHMPLPQMLDTPYNQLNPKVPQSPRHSPRRRSVIGMLADRSLSAAEFKLHQTSSFTAPYNSSFTNAHRRVSEDEQAYALSSNAPLMKVHAPGHDSRIGSADSVSKDTRLAQLRKQMEMINREIARASQDEEGRGKKKKLESDMEIPNLYRDSSSDAEYERERRRRRKERKEKERKEKERRARANEGAYDGEDRGVC